MERKELRVGRVGEYEFQFWECWETDAQHPEVPERHWFRGPNGMEAATAEALLQQLMGGAGTDVETQISTVEADSRPSAPAAVELESPRLALIADQSSPVVEEEEDREDPTLDAQTDREAYLRGQAFEMEHPWLWGEDRYAPEQNATLCQMKMAWHAERNKAVHPELHAAALDPKKYREYLEKYDRASEEAGIEMPDEDWQPAAAESVRCQFIKADGKQCGSPALKRKRLCYFHSKTTDGRKRGKRQGKDADSPSGMRGPELELPVLEDDLAIQMAITDICRRLASESLEPKRAATLLYGLQVAAVAVRRTARNRK